MYNVRKIDNSIYWIGGNDRRLALFENVFPIPKGVSFNSYFIDDEKTVVLDTVDSAVGSQFFENLEHLLKGRKLDYVIINHMEPDHCATLKDLVEKYPDVKIVCNNKIVAMIKQFFEFDIDSKAVIVKEGDSFSTGEHSFTFIMAPMVHWPEVMVTFDTTTKTLFSADAFGCFGALNGNVFADEVENKNDLLDDARRYYTNIVGKYGTQVQALLKKAQTLDIQKICPLHGPIWRKNIHWFIDKYNIWSSYQPEQKAVMIAYASVYGNTQNAAEILAGMLADKGISNIKMYDVSVTHPSTIVSESFRCSHLVFASTTYNAGIFCNMETVLTDLKQHNLQNRTVALIENGSWAPTAGSLMTQVFASMKNMTVLDSTVTIKSSVKKQQYDLISALADKIAEDFVAKATVNTAKIEPSAMFKLSYGLFVLSAKNDQKDNGCIINTVMQVTDNPKRIVIAVNKANYTHDMIMETKKFNVSILTESTPFSIFTRFGFQSGKTANKFDGFTDINRTENNIIYIEKYSNAVISGEVIMTEDCGTHTLFTADVTQSIVFNNEPSVTYDYYFKNIKPKPQPVQEKKKGWVCKICGYVYEGDPLPADFICPICKHGAEDFEPLQ